MKIKNKIATLLRNALVLLGLMLVHNTTQAQCDYRVGDPMGVSSFGYNATNTQKYILTDATGVIISSGATLTAPATAGVYNVSAYNDALPAQTITAGTNISALVPGVGDALSCPVLVDVCAALPLCYASTPATFTLKSVIAGSNRFATTQTYVLVNAATGLIVGINANASFTAPASLAGINYQYYAINYSTMPTGLAVGSLWSAVVLSAPLCDEIKQGVDYIAKLCVPTCPTITALVDPADVCQGTAFNLVANGLDNMAVADNGDQSFGIQYVYADAGTTMTNPYNVLDANYGGTLGTVDNTALTGADPAQVATATAVGASLAAGTYTIYAILNPTPADASCRPVSQISVEIKLTPTITGTLSACVGGTSTLTGSGTAAIATPWVSATPAVATVSAIGVVTGVSAGTSIITYTNSVGCLKTETVTITDVPTITGTLSACVGGTSTLTGSGTAATTLPWVSATPAVATVSAIGIVTGVSAGTSVITYTNSVGCTKTATVTITDVPTITGTLSACVGGTTTLTGNGTAAIATPWVSATPAVATVSAIGVVTGVSAGTSVITYTNSVGCTKTATVTITAAPAFVLTPTAPTSCAAPNNTGSIAIAYTNNDLISTMSVDGGLSVPFTSPVTGLTSGSHTIEISNVNTCSKTETITIGTAPGAPANPVAPTVAPVCFGNNVVITVSAVLATNETLHWYTSAAATTPLATATGLTNTITAPLVSGTVYIRIENSVSGCVSAVVPVSYTVNPVPVATVNNPTLCAGASSDLITVTATIGSPVNYTINYSALSNTAGFIDILTSASLSGASFTVPSTLAAGTYDGVISYLDANGCAGTDPFTITINASPTLTIVNPPAVCSPSSVDITTATVQTANTGITTTYWTDALATISLATPAAINASGTYYIKTVSSLGCSAIKPVIVTINAQPTAAITGGGVFCSGSTVTPVSVTAVGVAPFTISYTLNGITQPNITGSSPLTLGVAAGTYEVTNIVDANCTNTATGNKTITINNVPTVSINGGGLFCSGQTITPVTAIASGTSPFAVTYTLNGILQPTVSGTSPLTLGNVAGNYVITNIADGLCSVPVTGVSSSISINPTPTITGTLSACAGATTTLTGSGTAATTTPWVSATPAVATVSATGVVTGVSAGTSIITYTNSVGCTKTATVNVTACGSTLTMNVVDPCICMNNETIGDATGNSGQFEVNLNVGGGTGPYTVTFSASAYLYNTNNSINVPASFTALPAEADGSTNVHFKFKEGTIYNVTVTDALGANFSLFSLGGCEYPSIDAGINQSTCSGASVDLTASTTGATSLVWSNGANTASINVSPSISSTYTVTATNAVGCNVEDQVSVAINCTFTNVSGVVQGTEDENGNGILDPGEDVDADGVLDVNFPIPGAVVYLLASDGTVIATTIASATGTYIFTGVPANATLDYVITSSSPLFTALNPGGNAITLTNLPIAGSSNNNFIFTYIVLVSLDITTMSIQGNCDNTTITWSIANENNINNYNVEKSLDGINWTLVETVKATNNVNLQTYVSSTKTTNEGTVYYRIVQVDLDGKISYSSTKSVLINCASFTTLNIYPSPTSGLIFVELEINNDEDAIVSITDLLGRQLLTKEVALVKGLNKLSLDISSLAASLYFVGVQTQSKKQQVKIEKISN